MNDLTYIRNETSTFLWPDPEEFVVSVIEPLKNPSQWKNEVYKGNQKHYNIFLELTSLQK